MDISLNSANRKHRLVKKAQNRTHNNDKICQLKCKHCAEEKNNDKHITNTKTCPEFQHQYEIKKGMKINKI